MEGYIDVPGGKVWYTRVGESGRTPLLVLHGGPGNTHDALKHGLGRMGEDRPVVFYDQLGSGHSDRPSDSALWTMDRFMEELACVRAALGLEEVHLLGHSWGTMLAASYLTERKPAGVRSAVFSSPCLSAPRWKADADRCLSLLPEDVQAAIARHEAEGSTDSEAYGEAMKAFNERFVCRLDPLPAVLAEGRAKANKDIYMQMWGPSEFCPTGTLRTYDVTPRLHEIEVPALFVCGRYDEATPESTFYYHSLVPGSEYHVFPESAHMAYLEENDAYVDVVESFLTRVESR